MGVAQVIAYLTSLPNCAHTLSQVILHFTGQRVPAKLGSRRNPEHLAWAYRLDRARTTLKDQGIPLRCRRLGRHREYSAVPGGQM